MPAVFLIVSVIGLLFTINAFRPLRVEVLSLPAFFAGWLTSELPVHHLVWQMVATALFIAGGALDDWAGLVGLGITVVSWCGLVVLVAQASRAGAVMEAALQETLGEDYRADMAPELCDDDAPVLR